MNLISGAVAKVGSFFGGGQLKKFLSVLLVGSILLTTNVNGSPELSAKAANKKVDKMLSRDDSNRPKTTGQWQEQAREVKGDPGERAKRIGEQSADAVKDFGAMYPDVAKRSAKELEKNLSD